MKQRHVMIDFTTERNVQNNAHTPTNQPADCQWSAAVVGRDSIPGSLHLLLLVCVFGECD